jgi:hypothetical protein
LKRGHNIKYRPYAFTEHGAIMAATFLNQKIRPLLLPPPEPAKTKIGFGVREASARYSPKTRSKKKP